MIIGKRPQPRALIIEKIIRKIALKRAKSRQKKLAKQTLTHVRELPEHTKRDIGWFNV